MSLVVLGNPARNLEISFVHFLFISLLAVIISHHHRLSDVDCLVGITATISNDLRTIHVRMRLFIIFIFFFELVWRYKLLCRGFSCCDSYCLDFGAKLNQLFIVVFIIRILEGSEVIRLLIWLLLFLLCFLFDLIFKNGGRLNFKWLINLLIAFLNCMDFDIYA